MSNSTKAKVCCDCNKTNGKWTCSCSKNSGATPAPESNSPQENTRSVVQQKVNALVQKNSLNLPPNSRRAGAPTENIRNAAQGLSRPGPPAGQQRESLNLPPNSRRAGAPTENIRKAVQGLSKPVPPPVAATGISNQTQEEDLLNMSSPSVGGKRGRRTLRKRKLSRKSKRKSSRK